MNSPFELVPDARAVLDRSPSDRASFVQKDCWVHTPTSRVAFQWMEYLLRSQRVGRPRCLLVVAAAGMGKSSMLREFASRHPIVPTEDPLRTQRAVLVVDVTDAGGGAKALRRAIMRAAWPSAKYVPDSVNDLYATLQAQGVRMLLLDEAGDLMKCGPSLQLRTVTHLKEISNQSKINIVCAAVEGLDHVLLLDQQLYTRFKPIIKVPKWTESQDFRNFLYGLEMHLPFPERSYLDSAAVVRWLLRYSANTDDVVGFIHDAAIWEDRRGFSIAAEKSPPP